jgi:hypothetical protein
MTQLPAVATFYIMHRRRAWGCMWVLAGRTGFVSDRAVEVWMSRVAYFWKSRRHGRCDIRRTFVAAIVFSNISVVGPGGNALSQPAISACNYYAVQCRSGINSPLCTQLKQRCDAVSIGAAPNRSGATATPGRAVPDTMLEMPDCGPDEELVLVPTCLCGGTANQEAAAEANPDCASCSSDGTRLSCQTRY